MKLDVSNKEAVIHRGLQTYMEALLTFEFDLENIDADFIRNMKILFSTNSFIEAKTLLPNDAYDMLIRSFHTSNEPMQTGRSLLNDASVRSGLEVTPSMFKNHLKNYIYQLIDNHPNKDTLLSGAINAQTFIEEDPIDTSFDWKTIATTFKQRSKPQIKVILNYFGKTQSMPGYFDTGTFEAKDDEPIHLNYLSMFLTSKEHTNLSMTAKNVTLKTKEQDQEPTSYCSIQ